MTDNQAIYEEILCKFILNLPRQQLEDPCRQSFHIQKAFYYYVDEVRGGNKSIKDWDKQRTEFINRLKECCPTSIKMSPQLLLNKIVENKPVCGAIIFNHNNSKVLIVRVRNKYGFPKGKWNQYESPKDCAIREVQQETGIDIKDRIDANIVITFESHGQISYFFLARGVSEEERLRRDFKELDEILWMRLQDVRRHMKNSFAQKARMAWFIFDKDYSKREEYRVVYNKYGGTGDSFDYKANPLYNFSLNKQQLINTIFK